MGGVTPDRSREVPIPERAGTASRKGPRSARPIKSVHFRLQNLACPGLRARVVAAWGQFPERSPGCWPLEREQASTREPAPQRRQRVSAGCSCVSVFSRRCSETRCRCCRGRPQVLLRVLVVLCRCCGGRASAKTRGGATPAQRGGAGTGGAETGPATFLDPGGRSREAQRSGFSPWKRSFCSSG